MWDFILNIFPAIKNWFTSSSWTEISGVIALWVLAFDRLAKITPNNTDNQIIEWLAKIFAVLGVKVPDLEENSKGQIVAK